MVIYMAVLHRYSWHLHAHLLRTQIEFSCHFEELSLIHSSATSPYE